MAGWGLQPSKCSEEVAAKPSVLKSFSAKGPPNPVLLKEAGRLRDDFRRVCRHPRQVQHSNSCHAGKELGQAYALNPKPKPEYIGRTPRPVVVTRRHYKVQLGSYDFPIRPSVQGGGSS